MEHRSFFKAACVAVCVLYLPVPCQAQTHIFIDELGGDDQSLDPSALGGAWQSLTKLNTVYFNGLPSNTIVHLVRGGHYFGTITLAGSAANVSILAEPLVDAAERPIISGTDFVAQGAWTNLGGGDYRMQIPGLLTEYYLFDGEHPDAIRKPIARYPDTGFLRNDVYTNQTSSGKILPEIPISGLDPANATLVVRTKNFQYENVRVQQLNGSGELVFTPNLKNDIGQEDWGFFLQGTQDLISQNGEWGVEPDQGVPYLYYRTGNPNVAPEHVSLSRREKGIGIPPGCTTITVQGIAFVGQFGAGIAVEQATGVTIRDCHFREVRRGIDDRASAAGTGHLYEYNIFSNCDEFALRSYADNTIIRLNTFNDIGMVPGLIGILDPPLDYNEDVFGTYSCMPLGGHGYTVEDNHFAGVGNAGISASGAGVIQRNYLSRTVQTLNDAGGIQIDYCDGLQIRNNIIYKVGNVEETMESVASEYFADEPILFGIYYGDHYIVNTVVDGNTVSACGRGVHVDHNLCSEDAVVTNNTLFGNDVQLSITDLSNYRQDEMVDDYNVPLPSACLGVANFALLGTGANYRPSYSDKYEGNILYSMSSDQRCLEFGQAWANGYSGTSAPLVDFGTFDKNYYFNPFSEVLIHQGLEYDVPNVTPYLGPHKIPWTLRGWRKATGKDLNSFESPIHRKDHALIDTDPTNIPFDEDFDSGVDSEWLIPGFCDPVSVPVNGTDLAIATVITCPWLERSNCTLCTDPVIDGNNTGTYLYRFKMRANGTDAVRLATVYQESGPSGYRDAEYIGVSPEWRDYSVVVDVTPGNSANDKIQNAFQNVQLALGANAGSEIFLNDLFVEKCTPDLNYADNVLAFEHILRYNNPLGQDANDIQDVNASFTLYGTSSDCWSDVYGQIYPGGATIDLDPWESIVLFKLSNGFDITNGYTVSGDEVWTDDQNIKGSLVIPSGTSLTIDGATIGFADTRLNSNPLTNVLVQPGGALRLVNGALLTSVPGSACEGALWDGVKNLGTGTSIGAGLVEMTGGARISNAYTGILCADLDPVGANYVGAGGGGMLVLDGATFDNNWRDVLRTHYTDHVDQVVNNCSFVTTRPLLYPQLYPSAHVHMFRTGRTFMHGSTFGNLRDELPSSYIHRGIFGVMGADCELIIEPLGIDGPKNKFYNLFFGVGHLSIPNNFFLTVDRTEFNGCARSTWIIATNNVTFTRNSVQVPELYGGSSGADYGTYMYNSILFEFEDNVFTGVGTTTPKAGSIFSSCGGSDESIYNNNYDGFVGNSGNVYSAGLIISGPNRVESGIYEGIGLKWKCNDCSVLTENDHDVAFTDLDVSVADQQGSGMTTQSPAGNIYANLQNGCANDPDKHLYVEDSDVSTFAYWHHTDQSQTELVPDCASPPILVTDEVGTWYHDAIQVYSNDLLAGSCTTAVGQLQEVEDLEDEIIYAEEQKETLVEVYDDWKDGGDTQHLIDFIQNTANSSLAVRNELMLVAPAVTLAAWREVFERIPAMNPWHIAQALIANSPLSADVLRLLPDYDFHPYYEQLVEDAQNGGTSMHTIYLSEIAHFSGQQARALGDLTRKALRSDNAMDLANARGWHEAHPVHTSMQSILSISYALSDLQRARQIVDNELVASPDRDFWEVQDLYLGLLENGDGPEDLDLASQQALLPLALSRSHGSGNAQAWLSLFGGSFPDHVVLPVRNRTPQQKPKEERNEPPAFINVHPNPSNGPVVVVMTLPEGAEGGIVRITDPVGRLVNEQSFKGDLQVMDLDTRNLRSGVYAAVLVADGIRIGVAKFELVR